MEGVLAFNSLAQSISGLSQMSLEQIKKKKVKDLKHQQDVFELTKQHVDDSYKVNQTNDSRHIDTYA